MHLMLLLMASSDPVDQGTYKARYPTKLPSPQEVAALSRCLDAWSDHPFGGDISETEVRVVGGQVRVMGFGSSEPEDRLHTDYPQLVLLMTSVSAVSRTTYDLQNPNGWYCMHTTTTVLGQHRVNLACGAQLASSREHGVVVLGEDEHSGKAGVVEVEGGGGIVVLGELEVNKGKCPPRSPEEILRTADEPLDPEAFDLY